MKKWFIIALLVVGAIFVPAVSAEIIIDEELSDFKDTGIQFTKPAYASSYSTMDVRFVGFHHIEDHQNLAYVGLMKPASGVSNMLPEGRNTLTYTLDGVTKPLVVQVTYWRNILGTVTHYEFLLFFQEWDIGAATGTKKVSLSSSLWRSADSQVNHATAASNVAYIAGYESWGLKDEYTMTVASTTNWDNHIVVTKNANFYDINLYREIDGKYYTSSLVINGLYSTSNTDLHLSYPVNNVNEISVITPSKSYNWTLTSGGEPPDSHSVTVYAQNGDTGALIADTNLNVNLYETETWYNSTLEWGWDSIELPAGNYEFYAEKSGFTQYLPGRLTVDGVDDNINLLLYPNSGTPPAGNVTLQVWCNYGVLGSGNRYGVPGAEVSIIGLAGEGAGYSSGILTANEQGFVTVEAPGNTSYSAYGSKIGYISGETEFSVLTGSPVHVSISLTPGAVPTEPPITPNPTVTPNPTETPVPGGFMDDAGNGIAQLFGVSLAVGKMLLGFLIALAVGMGTAKQLEGGAPEFVVGFTGAAFLTTVAGLIPIGFFVLVAVLAGIYLGKSYIGGGEGGR